MKYILLILFIIIVVILVFVYRSFTLPVKLRKAEEHMEEGEYSNASNIVKGILDKKKDYVPARYLRALLLMRQNQYLMAISELNSILAIADFNRHVNEVDIHYHLAQLYNDTKAWQKEIEEYKIILTFNPDDIQGNYRIGLAHYRQKNYKKTKDHFSKVVLLDPEMKDCYLPLGVSCYEISDYEKAEQNLLKSMNAPGDHSEASYYLGSIYSMKKDYDNAVMMLDNAKNDRKYYIKSLYLIGEVCSEQQQYEKAIEYLEQGLNNLKEKTEEGDAYRDLLAEAYELSNQIGEAIHHWEKIASENPGFRSTKMKLESYRGLLDNKHLMAMFSSSLDELQPLVVEIISSLNYNIISKERVSSNEYQYKAYNIKRTNDPSRVITFNRTTREITEGQIVEFQKRIAAEKCKSGIYITTSKFSLRAKSSASSKMIDLYGSDYVSKTIEKINSRKKTRK